MQCPFCSDEGNRVIDSRLARDGSEIRRRRECDECGRRFTTRERIEETIPRVIKHDERREEYDRHKLLRGIEHACVKRPVSTEAVERLVDRVERALHESGEREVTSDHIGRRVLEELSAIDVLAAVRFASVFRDFSSPSDYEAFFSEIALDNTSNNTSNNTSSNTSDKPSDVGETEGAGATDELMEERAGAAVEGTVRSLRAGR